MYYIGVRYLGLTFSYLKKNWWILLLFFLVPAVVQGLLSVPFYEVVYVTQIRGETVSGFNSLFFKLFGDSWTYAWPVILISVLQVISMSFAMGWMERHFRTGVRSLTRPFNAAANMIKPIIWVVLIVSAISIAWRFVILGATALVREICFLSGATPNATVIILSVVAVILFFVHVWIILPILLWQPIMNEMGYSLRDTASFSFRVMSGKLFRLFIGYILPMGVVLAVTMVVNFTSLPQHAVIIVHSLVHLFTLVYSCAYLMCTAFDVLEFDRRDIKRLGG